MGLISGLLLLPLAPVRATAWCAERIADAAEAETYDPAPLMTQLRALHRALEDGEIGEAEFETREEQLLLAIQQRQDPAHQAPPRPVAPDHPAD
ncbi:gas vesicle protein GvpG [Streptomyces sp. DSM 44915]|uniref:Gas vesicle protein GvpG n=1 Tax=Streptomyces chisholmiae TaxID=3075540 RepID=A0ABU2JLA3_9ACTN|nr:gas vesicle protein GvpG [Streptomyces sp. DSM 44915]MDT0265766.1 gas vesicle protein GvpG [Streptomyces sp. DSM 44915]